MKPYDVVATRRERLRDVIKTRFNGKQTRFVEETGINAGELSGLLRDRYFGEKKARSLETALNLPCLWLDGLADSNPADSVVADFAWTYNNVNDKGKEYLIRTIEAVKAGYLEGLGDKRNKA